MNHSGSGIPSLSALLTTATVKLHLQGAGRGEVLAELVDQIAEISDQPAARKKLLEALEEREQLHSTGIGDGVALPHARNALVGLVEHPILIFGRHDKGVSYGAIDGAPAQLFFLLVAPTVTQHLAMLARISRLLRNPKLRKALLAAQQPEEICVLIREAEEKTAGAS
jgi:mannitol/fructose-specific phosphotransferase system IIA component (Ntr-type)